MFLSIIIDVCNLKFNSFPNTIFLNWNYLVLDQIVLGNNYSNINQQNSSGILNYLEINQNSNYNNLNQKLFKNSSNINSLIDRTDILKNQNLIYRQKIFALEQNIQYKEKLLKVYINKFNILNSKVNNILDS